MKFSAQDLLTLLKGDGLGEVRASTYVQDVNEPFLVQLCRTSALPGIKREMISLLRELGIQSQGFLVGGVSTKQRSWKKQNRAKQTVG